MVCVFCRAMRLEDNEARALLEEYMGPHYEIKRHMAVLNLPAPLQLIFVNFSFVVKI